MEDIFRATEGGPRTIKKQWARVFLTSHVLGANKSVLQLSVSMAFCGWALCWAELVFCNEDYNEIQNILFLCNWSVGWLSNSFIFITSISFSVKLVIMVSLLGTHYCPQVKVILDLVWFIGFPCPQCTNNQNQPCFGCLASDYITLASLPNSLCLSLGKSFFVLFTKLVLKFMEHCRGKEAFGAWDWQRT